LLDPDTTYQQLLQYMPDSVSIIMSEPVPLTYAFCTKAECWQNLSNMKYLDVGHHRCTRAPPERRVPTTPSTAASTSTVEGGTTPSPTPSTAASASAVEEAPARAVTGHRRYPPVKGSCVCSYGEMCLYRLCPHKYVAKKCAQCDNLVHSMCAHELGHSPNVRLCPIHANDHLREQAVIEKAEIKKGRHTPLDVLGAVKQMHNKWVIGREHCDSGGGQYFAREKVRAARREKCKEFPRKPADQYEVDKEHTRYMQFIPVHDPNRERLFTHYVIGTQASRLARMQRYERAHNLGAHAPVQPCTITASSIARKQTYIVTANRSAGVTADEVEVTTLEDGHTVAMYRTGEAVVFTLRDSRVHGRHEVQAVPHLGVKATEQGTWRLNHSDSTLDRLIWFNKRDMVVWTASPLQAARNARSTTSRSRIRTALRSCPVLPVHKRPRIRKRGARGCVCGALTCRSLVGQLLKTGKVSFHVQFVVPSINLNNKPEAAPSWIGEDPLPLTTRKGRKQRSELTKWVDYLHARAVQTALDCPRTQAHAGTRVPRFSMIHWHPQFLYDSMQQGWKPGHTHTHTHHTLTPLHPSTE
jgi:hypothetical protein